MRIDVLRNSWVDMITAAQTVGPMNHFSFATYTFDQQLNVVQPLTSNLNTAKSTAAGIDLMQVPSTGPGSTYTDAALTAITPLIPAAGDGSTQSAAKR